MDEYFEKMNKFEKNFAKKDFDYNYNENNDSDAEEDKIKEEVDLFLSKEEMIKRYVILQKKLNEKIKENKQNQLTLIETNKKHQDLLDSLTKDSQIDFKEKKIIEMHKKNQDLGLKIEKQKLRIKQLEDSLEEVKKNLEDGEKKNSEKIPTPESLSPDDPVELKKKIKQGDAKVVELRQKLQNLKEENFKLSTCIKREIGDNIDIEKISKDKAGWKGRQEIIEIQKIKIKNLENQVQQLNKGINLLL
jgi:predicted RNase H-like nuclease (RuvC/YqgF family)